MASFTSLNSRVVPLPTNDIDTDQIIPARFLKVIDKNGLGTHLFSDWRYRSDGTPQPEFVLNTPEAQGAQILLAGDNFGCGSSREHAPWALQQYGFKAIIAPSYADIFFTNCFKNGLLPIVLSEAEVDHLFHEVAAHPGFRLTIDLPAQTVSPGSGKTFHFDVEPTRKHNLVEGLDEIGLTLRHADEIKAYEERRKQTEPWIFS